MSFTPLRVRSHGSLLHGTASPAQLVTRALELGYDALALTDRDNLCLGVPFQLGARADGLKPLPGAEVTRGDGAAGGEALLLALDRRGWTSLCAVLTARHLESSFDLVRALGEHWSG
ncbi:MAG TPA: PHP domain-containing protein, partial [Candidatus Eisenbacteria bacterium]|nr:PHP domain-containing protein [Candidatus Eisenbacteria bacterium]